MGMGGDRTNGEENLSSPRRPSGQRALAVRETVVIRAGGTYGKGRLRSHSARNPEHHTFVKINRQR